MQYIVRGGCSCPVGEKVYTEGDSIELTDDQYKARCHTVEPFIGPEDPAVKDPAVKAPVVKAPAATSTPLPPQLNRSRLSNE